MRKMTWIDWLTASLALVLVPLAGWLAWRGKPRERRRARKALRMPPGPQIRR